MMWKKRQAIYFWFRHRSCGFAFSLTHRFRVGVELFINEWYHKGIGRVTLLDFGHEDSRIATHSKMPELLAFN